MNMNLTWPSESQCTVILTALRLPYFSLFCHSSPRWPQTWGRNAQILTPGRLLRRRSLLGSSLWRWRPSEWLAGEMFLESFSQFQYFVTAWICAALLRCSPESSVSAHYGFDSQLISFQISQWSSYSPLNTCRVGREGLNVPECLIIAHSRTPGVRIPVSVSSLRSIVSVSLAISSVH